MQFPIRPDCIIPHEFLLSGMKGAPKGFATYISSIHLQMLLALDRALAIIQVRGVGGANAHVTLMEK